MRRWLAVLALLAGALALPACAKRLAPPLPEGEEYVYPAPEAGELPQADKATLQLAWREVQAGDTAAAVKRYEKLLRRYPDSAAVRTGLGYARLRAGQAAAAAQAFSATLERHPQDVPALVGQGSLAVRRGDLEAAVEFYRRAAAVAPDDAVVRKRLAALKLQVTDRRMARGRGCARAGRHRGGGARLHGGARGRARADGRPARARAGARRARRPQGSRSRCWRPTSPASGWCCSSSAGCCARSRSTRGRSRSTRACSPTARATRRRARANGAPARASSRSPCRRSTGRSWRRRASRARTSRRCWRSGCRRCGGRGPGEPRVAVDITGSWARDQVARVLALGIMDVYPNHTFQPGAIVRRVDLARAAARTLDVLRWPRGRRGAADRHVARAPRLRRRRARAGGGADGLTPTGAFEPWRPVTGREATTSWTPWRVFRARSPNRLPSGPRRRNGREGAAAERPALLRALRRRHREPGSPGGAPELPQGHGGLLRERGRRLLLHDRRPAASR